MASKQHFVPQFYLNAFVDPHSLAYSDRYLWVIDLQNRTVKRRSVRNVARIAGFYDWKELQDIAPSIESIYSQIESRTARVLARLRNGDFRLNAKDKYHLSVFLGLQLTRTPRFRRASKDALVRHALDGADRLICDRDRLQKSLDKFNKGKSPSGPILTADNIADFIKNRRFDIVPNQDYMLQTTLGVGLEFSKLIFTMQWLFALSAEKALFFTSDVPVAILTPDAKPRKIDFEGYHNPELEISFPISPSCMLLLRNGMHPMTSVLCGDDVVNEINRRVFPVVDRYVFCSSEPQGRWALEQRPITVVG